MFIVSPEIYPLRKVFPDEYANMSPLERSRYANGKLKYPDAKSIFDAFVYSLILIVPSIYYLLRKS